MLKKILLSLVISTCAFSAVNSIEFKGVPFFIPSNVQALMNMPKEQIKTLGEDTVKAVEAWDSIRDLIIKEKLIKFRKKTEEEIEKLKIGREFCLYRNKVYLGSIEWLESAKWSAESCSSFINLSDQTLNQVNAYNHHLELNNKELCEINLKLQQLESPKFYLAIRLQNLLKLIEEAID